MKTILIAGSKSLECSAELERTLAERLGAAVVSQAGWRLLTGGARGSGCGEGRGGVDYHAAFGAQKKINDRTIEREKILTLLPRDGRSDLFQIGSVLRSRAKSTPARRFELVSRADCAVLIEGHEGTAQVVEYSIAAGKPVIPLACSGGESRRVWEAGAYRTELLQILGLKDPSPDLAMIEGGVSTPDALTDTCMKVMKRLLRPACFVVMPFSLPHSDTLWSKVLQPVIEAAGLTAVRADLVHNVGEILEDITKCITEAVVVIVDISEANPNVMYELGYAHALGKPTILICSAGDKKAWDRELPFDIRGMRVIPFGSRNRRKLADELTVLLTELTKGEQ